MKKFGIILTLLLSLSVIIVGYIHWNNKLDFIAKASSSINNQNTTNNRLRNENNKSSEENTVVNRFKVNPVELQKLVAKLPEEISDEFLTAYEKQQSVKMLIVGSPALGSETNGWSIIAADKLQELYGDDFLDVVIMEFDGTSTEFIVSDLAQDIVTEEANLILFEPFTLEDNGGLVPIEKSHENIKIFIESILAKNSNSAIILQPPHPIYAASLYPQQVNALAEFANTEGIPYLNHWQVWPDPNSEEIRDYLDETGMPNEKGHALWAKYVVDYFSGN